MWTRNWARKRKGKVPEQCRLWHRPQTRQDTCRREIRAVLFRGHVVLGNVADKCQVFVPHPGHMLLENILIGGKI